MHELSIASSIVDMVIEEAETRGVRILAVHLKLGPLSGVFGDALLGSYEMACAGTPIEGSRLVIEPVPVKVFCAVCGEPRLVASFQWLRCPECATASSEVLEGNELLVTALEVET
jgi:hydrogenase nickel incorporation protein HypA/HybF